MSIEEARGKYAQLMYFAREKLWRHGENVCAESAQTMDDWVFRVWRAFCQDKQGMMNDALREYKTAEPRRECAVPAMIGMQIIYKRNKDTEGQIMVEKKLQADRYARSVGGWLHGAAMLWYSGDLAGAREIISRFQDDYSDYRDEYTSFATLRAWIDLTSGRGALTEKCGALFKSVMDSEAANDDVLDIDAALGRAAYFDRKNQDYPAQDVLNQIIAAHPSFLPALVVKARYLMKVEDWEQATETTQRVLAKDAVNIEAMSLKVLFLLVKEAAYSDAGQQVTELQIAMQQREPRNAALFFQYAQCFSRLSGSDFVFLGTTMKLAETALIMDGRSTDFQSEVAYQNMLRGDFKVAAAGYRKAMAASTDGGMTPMLGLIRCLIHMGKLDDAAKEIELPNEMQPSNQHNAELCLLNAQLLWRRNKDQGKSIVKLDQAAAAHKQDIMSLPTGMDLFIKLNPPLMLDIAKEYTQHCRTEPPEPGMSANDPIAEKCRRHLELLIRHNPGCVEGHLLLSRIYFISGDVEKAQSMVARCIQQHGTATPDAHILSAQMYQYVGNTRGAVLALEQALTLDFEIKDQPQYNLLRGTLLAANGLHVQAQDALKLALSLMQKPERVTGTGRPIQPLSVQDYVSLYLQLAQTYLKMGDVEEARNTVAEATKVFSDTIQSGRVVIAQSMIVARTDPDKAIEILKQVPPKNEYFIAAKTRMADLYLVHRQNRRLYAECFKEMVEAMPTSQSYLKLGEAYTQIQDPEQAITAYERAKALDPNNGELAVRIGRALVATHDYQRALRYYRDAVAAEENKFTVRADLATLLWRLGETENAIAELSKAPVIEKIPTPDEDVMTSIERVNCALLMYKILLHSSSNGIPKAAAARLLKARDYQQHVLNTKMRGESPDTLHQQRLIASIIAVELGTFYSSQGAFDEAHDSFKEALKYNETSEQAMLGMARSYLKFGHVEECENQCNTLLRINPDCDEAVVVLADLMYRRDRFEDAAHHFSQLLSRRPDNYKAMVKYIELLRRAGRLPDAEEVIRAAQKPLKAGQRPDGGYSYAQGLQHHYTNNNREALTHFNLARLPADTEWSQLAVERMINIYLAPDNENLWEDTRTRDETLENIKVAERLLMQIQDPSKREILTCYCLIASKKKEQLSTAVQQLQEIIVRTASASGSGKAGKLIVQDGEEEDDETTGVVVENINVPATVALATALQLLKQTSKAQTYLKRFNAVPFRSDESEHFERGWLLHSDMYIQKAKYDLAQEQLKRTINVNKSCPRAWEMLGLIFEKEQAYRDAAECYENAWKLVSERDASIGFKLAFNYLKANRLVQSIDVCRKVLEMHPNYPRIRTDVMDVASSMIRP